MKIACEIVEDLLPLYIDDACSDQSRCVVEEHLRECEECKKAVECAQRDVIPNVQLDETAADRVAERGFKKIRRHWLASLLLVALLIPACILGWNQYRGQGVSFTNLHELYIGNAFMSQLQEGNYKGAFEHIDIDAMKEAWSSEWLEKEVLADIEEDGCVEFCEAATPLEDAGGISGYRYLGILEESSSYYLVYMVTVGGEEHEVGVDVGDNGVRSFGCEGSFLEDPMAYFGLWTEWLWEKYEGCYFDFETKQYVYPDKE